MTRRVRQRVPYHSEVGHVSLTNIKRTTNTRFAQPTLRHINTASMTAFSSLSNSSGSPCSIGATTLLLTTACAATTVAAVLLCNRKHRLYQRRPFLRPLPPLHVHLDLKGVSVRESDLALFRSLLDPSITLSHGQEVDPRTQLLIANFPTKGEEEGRRKGENIYYRSSNEGESLSITSYQSEGKTSVLP